MRKSILITGIIAGIITVAVIACTSGSSGKEENNSQPTNDERIKRGEYLVSVIGCDDCHSPKSMGPNGPEIIPELRLSGFNQNTRLPAFDTAAVSKGWSLFAPDFTAILGSWGISYAANLTSDETGIGNWPEENFIRAIRTGKYKGIASNRNLLPPMPWFVYKNMTDEDLKSIFAYLKSTKSVENIVPAPKTLADLK